MNPCVFCGSIEGRGTVEHVIPQWTRRCLDVHGPLTLFAHDAPSDSERTRVDDLQHLNVTLRDAICRSCNTGFLSRLEAAVRPILSPMITTATPTTLDAASQALLATWAVKTVLLFELAMRQKYPSSRLTEGYRASTAELAWLWAENRPPPRALVWLACWDCRSSTAVMYEPSEAVLPAADGRPVTGHLTTLAVGFVALQVFTVDFVAADEHGAVAWNANVPSSLRSTVDRIWPSRAGEIAWPRPAFAKNSWSGLVTWDGVLRPPQSAP